MDDEFSQISVFPRHRHNRANLAAQSGADAQAQLELEMMAPMNAPAKAAPTKIGSFQSDTAAETKADVKKAEKVLEEKKKEIKAAEALVAEKKQVANVAPAESEDEDEEPMAPPAPAVGKPGKSCQDSPAVKAREAYDKLKAEMLAKITELVAETQSLKNEAREANAKSAEFQ